MLRMFPLSKAQERVVVEKAAKKPNSDPSARGRFVWEDGDLEIYSPQEARKAFPWAFEGEVQPTANDTVRPEPNTDGLDIRKEEHK